MVNDALEMHRRLLEQLAQLAEDAIKARQLEVEVGVRHRSLLGRIKEVGDFQHATCVLHEDGICGPNTTSALSVVLGRARARRA